jgi:hypothetical protein
MSSKKAKAEAAPSVAFTVMDRLKALYQTTIQPLEEAYNFGACGIRWRVV